jgi:hypothetical protein
VGENRRYDRSAQIDAATEAEVRALRIIAGLIGKGSRLVTDRDVARQVEEVLRAVATELGNGRAVPRLLLGLAPCSTRIGVVCAD